MDRAVFLDRDGVINDSRRPVNKWSDFVFLPRAREAIRLLNERGYQVFVVTNQGGVEMGHVTHEDLEDIHERMVASVRRAGGEIREVVYCPHFRKRCACRKPEPGMILGLAQRYNLDLRESWTVGDRDLDIEAGKRAGTRTAAVGPVPPKGADVAARDLWTAAEAIGAHEDALAERPRPV